MRCYLCISPITGIFQIVQAGIVVCDQCSKRAINSAGGSYIGDPEESDDIPTPINTGDDIVEWLITTFDKLSLSSVYKNLETSSLDVDHIKKVSELVSSLVSANRIHLSQNNQNKLEGLCNKLKDIDETNREIPRLLRKSSPELHDIGSNPNEDLIQHRVKENDSTRPRQISMHIGTNIASFRWEVNYKDELKDKNRDIYSNYFNSYDNQYQMWLHMYSNRCISNRRSYFGIRLWIRDGPNDSRWPFQGTITITVTNKFHLDMWKKVSKRVTINISLLKPFGRSEPFLFNYFDLVMPSESIDWLTIDCMVNVD